MDERTTLFDTIPDFLEMYSRYREFPVPDTSEFDEAEVLGVNYAFIQVRHRASNRSSVIDFSFTIKRYLIPNNTVSQEFREFSPCFKS